MWILTLFFTCGVGCGTPPQVDVGKFDNLLACQVAAYNWIKVPSNPQRAIKTYTCAQMVSR